LESYKSISMYISRESSFSLSDLTRRNNHLVKKNFNFFTYSREAIYAILMTNKITSDDEIILPNYLCGTVIESILPFSERIKFYNVDESMMFDALEVESLITDKTKVIFFVDYFGVVAKINKHLMGLLKSKEIIVIRDAAHSFLSLVSSKINHTNDGDYLITSVYKNLPFQVGAIAIGKLEKQKDFINLFVFLKRFSIALLKKILCFARQGEYINKNIKQITISNDPYVSYQWGLNSVILYSFILNHINFNKVVQRRKLLITQYYKVLILKSDFKPLFLEEKITNNTVLQGFPIICKNKKIRDNLIDIYRKNYIDVYTWPAFHKINVDRKIWEVVLVLPIDRRVLNILSYV